MVNMKLIFIYGPPAIGKLTVATELKSLTNYLIFHNHLTRDIVYEISNGNVKDNQDLVIKLRLDVFEYSALNNLNLIFTYVYEGPNDDEDVKNTYQTITNNGGKVLFVELMASKDSLLERVQDESRKKYHKLTDEEKLASIIDNHNYTSVPFDNVLKINNDRLSPNEVANQIVDYFKLK